MNATYPNKNKALISAITRFIYDTVGTNVVLFADIKKDAPVLKILPNVIPLSTFTSVLPCKGNALNWNKSYFIGILIFPQGRPGPNSLCSKLRGSLRQGWRVHLMRYTPDVTHQDDIPGREVEFWPTLQSLLCDSMH